MISQGTQIVDMKNCFFVREYQLINPKKKKIALAYHYFVTPNKY